MSRALSSLQKCGMLWHAAAALIHGRHPRMIVEICIQELPEFAIRVELSGTVLNQRFPLLLDVTDRRDGRPRNRIGAGRNDIVDLTIDNATNDVGMELLAFQPWKIFPDFVVALLPNSEAGKLPGSNQTKVEAIIEVMSKVRNGARAEGRRGNG